MNTTSDPRRRYKVAAVNDYELIVDGVAHMLAPFADRLEVCSRIVIGEAISCGPVDVALYDTFGRSGIVGEALDHLMGSPEIGHLALFTVDLRPELVRQARGVGVRAFISKALPCEGIVEAIERTGRGEAVFASAPDTLDLTESALSVLEWPGQRRGLTQRESEVLVLLGEGLTNTEVATALYVSKETVKTHVSTVFTKLGVRNRVQAANYVAETGAFARYQPADPADPVGHRSPA